MFERRNKELNLFYNPMVMDWWWNLSNKLEKKLEGIVDNIEWDLNVCTIKDRIQELPDENDKKNFQRRFDEYLELSKARP